MQRDMLKPSILYVWSVEMDTTINPVQDILYERMKRMELVTGSPYNIGVTTFPTDI